MKDKIAEIIFPGYKLNIYWRDLAPVRAERILSLFKNIQVEVECSLCEGTGDCCFPCRGTGKTTRPATPEELKKGGILIKKK